MNKWCSLILFLAVACVEPFEHSALTAPPDLLVVEGFINAGAGPTTFKLSRFSSLEGTADAPELNAQVYIEAESANPIQLSHTAGGNYTSEQLNISNNEAYRLRIVTEAGKDLCFGLCGRKACPCH